MSPVDPRHGTYRGYYAHRRDNEQACRACLDALSAYVKRYNFDKLQGRSRRVDSLGARRRIQALIALGWPVRHIWQEMGHTGRSAAQLRRILDGRDSISRRLADEIAVTYDRLSMTVPQPSGTTSRARRRALIEGWAPPLAWDNVDDPAEQPKARWKPRASKGYDEAAVLRLLAGEHVPCSRADKDETLRRWCAAGRSEAELCRRLGWKEGRYGRSAA